MVSEIYSHSWWFVKSDGQMLFQVLSLVIFETVCFASLRRSVAGL